MNRPPACLRLPDERGNNESYWSGLTVAPYTLARNNMYCMHKIWTKTHPHCRTALIQCTYIFYLWVYLQVWCRG